MSEQMIPVILFRNKNEHDRFLTLGPDFGDWEHENLDVTLDEVENALMIVRFDKQKPTEKDYNKYVEMHLEYKRKMIERYGPNAFISLDFEKVIEHYEPYHYEITEEQYLKAKENWD